MFNSDWEFDIPFLGITLHWFKGGYRRGPSNKHPRIIYEGWSKDACSVRLHPNPFKAWAHTRKVCGCQEL